MDLSTPSQARAQRIASAHSSINQEAAEEQIEPANRNKSEQQHIAD